MAEKDLIIKEKLKHNGLFDFSALYGFAHSWFKYEEYGIVEEEYSEKISGGAREIVFKWKTTKQLSDYFKIEIALKFEIRRMAEVEVEDGKSKKKMNNGEVEIEIKGALVKDPNSSWEGTPFLKFIRESYDKFIIPKRVDDVTEKLKGDVKNFKDDVKEFLEHSGRR